MNIRQRRTKRDTSSSSGSNALSARLDSYQTQLQARWQALSSRDQVALGALLLFLLLFIGGYGGYSVNEAAKESKAEYQQQVADYFWLRAQASNVDRNAISASADGTVESPTNSINSLLNSSGINDAQVVAVGDTIQLSFTHPSQATVSNALSKLQQQGWQLNQLTMQQDITTKQVQVQATLST